ncbi:MAG: nicotinate phosphoribosyltransferase [Candidatus Bathyarchaeota archaeon]|nr:nicotinate phosphoribosyltransferase [Candidatus Bathyarchaeota archaeon]MDH5733269.1 nicotinate phosphoribosyltransferase [Candidatus Bathyarchaeota archaeon]
MRLFHYAKDEEIKAGKTTDIYFVRTKQVLEAKGLDKLRVVAEVTPGEIHRGWSWGILCGIEEEARLFEGYPVDVYAMPEGSIFYHGDHKGVREPVMIIEGPYGDFCLLETPLLGLLCQSSGVATRAARIKKLTSEKIVVAFGIRRMHPVLSPMIDRAAYIGGFDGVSSLMGAETVNVEPSGTMPHALIIVFEDQVKAWKGFDEVMPREVPRVALVDTYFDEKIESIMAAEALKDRLYAVRLDTPGSRKGDFAEIVREVRWELDVRGYNHVKIFVSGGLNEETVKVLSDAGADAFGVGTAVSNAPTIDFAMDIVAVEGRLSAKRGKLGGKKQVWRCQKCLTDIVQTFDEPQPRCPHCGGKTEPMLRLLVKNGKIVAKLPRPREIREYVLEQIGNLTLE